MCEIRNISEVVDILTNCGLLLTLTDIKELSKHKITNYNFEKYGFEVDDELIQICLDRNFFPDYIVIKTFTQKRLQELFTHVTKVSEIMDYIKDREVTYDIECLRNACKTNNNKEIINFLIKQGVTHDLECLRNIIQNSNNDEIKIIFNNLKKIEK